MIKQLLTLLLLVSLSFTGKAQGENDQQLAVYYFQNGEFDKAQLYFSKLYDKQPNDFFYTYLRKCYLQLKDFKEAEKLSRKQQRRNPANLNYYIDLGETFSLQGDAEKAEKEYDQVIKRMSGDYSETVRLGAAFRDRNENDYALQVYARAEKLLSGNTYYFERAEIYNLQGKNEEMIRQYILHLDSRPYEMGRVQGQLTRVINFEMENNPKSELLRVELLKQVQKKPEDPVVNEMLIWYFEQTGDFQAAFAQVKALDKRKKEEGTRVFNFGMTCYTNEKYDLAVKAFEYLINEKGADGVYYLESRIYLVEVLKQKVMQRGIYTTEDLSNLKKNYESTLNDLGKNAATLKLVTGLARLKAFYLNQATEGQQLLEEALNFLGVKAMEQAEIKMELADILLLEGDVWDASLLYSQVEKSFKHDPIGHEAKFRNARISYYTGDFNWAKAQLDVLKASTSKLIANDAMQLSLLISDNLGFDSIPEALKFFARADLLAYQQQLDDAEKVLDTLSRKFPWHSLQDEMHFLHYRIKMQRKDYSGAATELESIVEKHSQDILADDALYYLGELYQYHFNDEEKAAEMYKKIMFDHPGSLYVVEARKRFRTLRGEKLN